ncbi:peptidyl-prolyl cis-trans isomerase [Shewanella psychropiezotolerans]|uniref:peptidylprolyl isomerase n=1 Tax=Shewanella psychropiezotolerans TaxID=2593655 RepID=A0ABX5X1L9_9GAMM|nr:MULTISPECIES: peptidylprolyl isomerase [Shewanella]MPY22523.1 peptidyl-prolyl cis-trans isomerase [Shewanella sp. YLB-07]QDO83166.1 peptidyl-prolyl cis-trans isomerase [Shewanella psychropiezotolerans]
MPLVFRQFIRDPFAHFILIGAALFGLYALVNDEELAPNRIIISEADIQRTANQWQQKWHRPPSESELLKVIERQIREEIYYREALALGLGQEDPIIRRRLAEKMEFIANDLLVPSDPSDEELAAYLAANPDKFVSPVRLSFSHIFYSADNVNSASQSNQETLLTHLNQSAEPKAYSGLGDSFNGKQHYEQIADYQIARIFGRRFEEQLIALPVGQWLGPIESGYGQHLVRIDDRIDAKLPPLTDIHDKVLPYWLAQQQERSNDSLYAKLKENYQIVIMMKPSQILEASLTSESQGLDGSPETVQ